jgi:hypothetical protein
MGRPADAGDVEPDVDCSGISHVDGDGRGGRADLGRDALGRGLVEVGDHHRRGVGRESPSATGADAGGAAGHQRDTAFELTHGLSSPRGPGMRIVGSPRETLGTNTCTVKKVRSRGRCYRWTAASGPAQHA